MRFVRCISLSLAAGLLLCCDSRSGGPPPEAAAPQAQDGSGPAGPGVQAPERLVYTTDPSVYTRGVPIAANTPYVTGGAIASYRVSPPLPDGLALDAATGAITGTPKAAAPAADYTVTGSNSAGSTSVTLSLTVNDPAPTARPQVTLAPYLTAGATGLPASTQDLGPGYTYTWALYGGTLATGQGTPAITFTAGNPGTLSVTVDVANSGGSVSGRADSTVVPAPDATLTLPDAVETLDASHSGSVPDQPGMTYTWTIVSGTSSATIRSGQGTSRVGFLAGGAAGTFQVQVKVQNQAGTAATNTGTVTIKTGY